VVELSHVEHILTQYHHAPEKDYLVNADALLFKILNVDEHQCNAKRGQKQERYAFQRTRL